MREKELIFSSGCLARIWVIKLPLRRPLTQFIFSVSQVCLWSGVARGQLSGQPAFFELKLKSYVRKGLVSWCAVFLVKKDDSHYDFPRESRGLVERLCPNFMYIFLNCASAHVQSLSRVQLFSPMGSSPPGSSVHRILQARIGEWVAISSSRRSMQPRDQTHIPISPALEGGFSTTVRPGKPNYNYTFI